MFHYIGMFHRLVNHIKIVKYDKAKTGKIFQTSRQAL